MEASETSAGEIIVDYEQLANQVSRHLSMLENKHSSIQGQLGVRLLLMALSSSSSSLKVC